MITPIDKGNLIHAALERFLLDVLARPEGERPTGRDPWTVEDRDRLEQIGSALCDQAEALGITGRPIFWRRDRRRILNDLDLFLVEDSHHRLRTAPARWPPSSPSGSRAGRTPSPSHWTAVGCCASAAASTGSTAAPKARPRHRLQDRLDLRLRRPRPTATPSPRAPSCSSPIYGLAGAPSRGTPRRPCGPSTGS